jgi:hypothetical protein
MVVKVLSQSPLAPEERKKTHWENIIHFELGEAAEAWTSSFREDRLRWTLDTSGSVAVTPEYAATCRGRLVDALRATGKPVE